MNASGLRQAPCPLRAQTRRSRCSSAAPLRVVASESMSDAYARVKAARAASKKKYERQEQIEKAGAFGGILGGVLGGASLPRRTGSAPSHGTARQLRVPQHGWATGLGGGSL